jgi:hypothetical protein
MKKYNSFYEDLGAGIAIELEVLNTIQKKYPKAYKIDGRFSGYDLFVPELNIGVEVKSDQKSLYTGNIVIEVEFNGKPSALSVTTAKYWVIYDGLSYNWFLVTRIKDCIRENKLRVAKFIGNGDTKIKKAYLIKKSILYKYQE